MHEQVRNRLRAVEAHNDRLSLSDFSVFAGTANELTKVAEYTANQDLSVRPGVRTYFAPVAFETFTTDGTGGNTETFSLSNDILQSKATSDDLLIYNGTTKESEDSINYSNDTFDFTDSGTNSTLSVFYAAGDKGRLVTRVTGPNGVQKDLLTLDPGLIHRRDKNEEPIRFDFQPNRPLEGVVPRDFRLEQYVDVPYQLKYEHDTGSGTVTADNAILSIPIRRSEQRIDQLGRAVRHDIAES